MSGGRAANQEGARCAGPERVRPRSQVGDRKLTGAIRHRFGDQPPLTRPDAHGRVGHWRAIQPVHDDAPDPAIPHERSLETLPSHARDSEV